MFCIQRGEKKKKKGGPFNVSCQKRVDAASKKKKRGEKVTGKKEEKKK